MLRCKRQAVLKEGSGNLDQQPGHDQAGGANAEHVLLVNSATRDIKGRYTVR
jgi:hypothetical protein